MPDSEVIDPQALGRLLEWGGPQLLTQMIRLFLENAPQRMEQIRVGFREGAARDAERGAHSLKSSSANVGATRLSQISERIEMMVSGGDLDGARALEEELAAAYARACAELEAELARAESGEARA